MNITACLVSNLREILRKISTVLFENNWCYRLHVYIYIFFFYKMNITLLEMVSYDGIYAN